MHPELYPPAHDNFTANGQPLLDAFGVSVRPRINEPARITFNIPFTSRSRAAIKRGAVAKIEGQLYVITALRKGSDNGRYFLTAIGRHIFWVVCAKHHLPQKFKIGAEAGAILGAAFSGVKYGANQIRMLGAEELAALGLEPVTERTDVNRDKLNPLEVLAVVMNHLGGEIYVDNFAFALVKSLGRETDAVFALDSSATGVERTEDDDNVVTRLIPYGRGNVEITNANGGQMHIDSPHINDPENSMYIREGYVDFSDIERPADLLRVASRLFAPENYFRIDRPKITYRVSAVDLWKTAQVSGGRPHVRLQIGDYARIIDRELGFNERVRVVALEEHPFEPQSSVVTLGDPPRFVVDVLDDLESGSSFFWQPKINLPPLPELPPLEDIAGEILGLLPAPEAYYFHRDRLETSFAALDITKPDPPPPQQWPAWAEAPAIAGDWGLRRFQRIAGRAAEFVEALVHNLREPYTEKPGWWDDEPQDWNGEWLTEWGEEPPNWDGAWLENPVEFEPETWADIAEQLTSSTGEPVYWAGEPGASRMTLADPVLARPPQYPENATQGQIDQINAGHRFAFAVWLRKTLAEHVTASLRLENDALYLTREVFTADENPAEPTPDGFAGIRLTDEAAQFWDRAEEEWRDMGAKGSPYLLVLPETPATQDEWDAIDPETLVFIYDESSPWAPEVK